MMLVTILTVVAIALAVVTLILRFPNWDTKLRRLFSPATVSIGGVIQKVQKPIKQPKLLDRYKILKRENKR